MLETIFLNTLDGLEFDTDSCDFSLYHSELWQQIVSDGFGVYIDWIACKENEKVLAAMPVAHLRRYGFLFCGSPLQGLFTEFAGPIFHEMLSAEERPRIFMEMLLRLKDLRPSHLEFSVSGNSALIDEAVIEFLPELGFKKSPRPTLVVPLGAGLQNVWNSFHSRARNMIRKAEKERVSGEVEALSGHTLDLYIDMLLNTFKRQNLAPIHPARAYRAQAERMNEKGSMFFVAARYNGELVSGGVFLIDRDRVVFHSGSSTPTGLKVAASSLVQWVAIQEAARRGATWYDMGGTGVSSIDRFKSTFGGIPTDHSRWIYETRMAYFGRTLAKQLASRGLLNVFPE